MRVGGQKSVRPGVGVDDVGEGETPDVPLEALVVRDARGRRVRPGRHGLGPRARTESIRRLSKTELLRGRVENPVDPDAAQRPRTRGECADVERPCPFVSCRYHLYLDVHETRGAIKYNFPDLEVDELRETCALDVAEQGGLTLEEVGELLNVTRERLRQIETGALARSRAAGGDVLELLAAELAAEAR